MTRRIGDSSPSRRSFLGCTGAAGLVLGAGCLSVFGRDAGRTTYEPEPLTEPPAGTPGELHYVIEERVPDYDLTVESVYENDGDLLVAYRSAAEKWQADRSSNETTESENESIEVGSMGGPLYTYTMEEVGVIAQAFNEICIKHGSGLQYEMLIGEIANPLDDQPWGWGAETGWFEAFNAGEMTATDLQLSLGQYIVYKEDVAGAGDEA